MAVTTISRTAYNALVDDSGTGTNGTVWQKSNVRDILDAIDAILASTITFGGGLVLANAISYPGGGSLSKHTSNGLFIGTVAGSSFDWVVTNPSGASAILTVPTGTTNVNFGGAIDAGQSYRGRAGAGGSLSNAFNIFWTGSAAQLWFDNVNVGNISLVSDARVKTNIRPLGKGLAAVLQLQPRAFEWATGNAHDPSGPQFGLIAQEAEAIVPELVTQMAPIAGLDETIAPEGLKRVDYVGLVPVLILAAQELHARLAALEGRS